jgi:hypothetical protein
MPDNWFITRNGQEEGPFKAADLRQFVKDGRLCDADRVRREDQQTSIAASKVRGLFPQAVASANPPNPQPEVPVVQSVPPELPTSPPAAPDTDSDPAVAVAQLFRATLEALLSRESSLSMAASLSPRRRDGVETYAGLAPGERILVVHDSTIFGVGTEGFVITDRAIAWSGQDGNRGRVAFSAIQGSSVFVDTQTGMPPAVCFRGPAAQRVPGKSLTLTALEDIAVFIARATRLHQGVDADRVLPMAMRLLGTGDVQGALAAWQRLLDDDVLLFPRLLKEVSKAEAAFPDDRDVAAFHATLARTAADRTCGWLVPRKGREPELLTAEALRERWRSGGLFADSPVKHVSDGPWSVARNTPAADGQRLAYATDTGELDEAQFCECVRSLARQGIRYESLHIFCPTTERVASVAGKPILHVGLTADELVLCWVTPDGGVAVERSPLFTVVWKLDDARTGRQIEIATARRTARISLQPSTGAAQFVRLASEVFLAGAERAIEENRRTDASRLLDRVIANGDTTERVRQARERVRADEEVLVVYEGGHPESVEPCVGTLRLDGDGFEFRSIAPETETFFRVSFDEVVDFAPPQRGALPSDLRKSLFGPDSLLSAGFGVAAACVIPGGALLVRSLSSTLAADKQAGPPMNRLVVIVLLAGTSYKLHFDVVGQTVAEMTQKAKSFWSRTARAKPRFRKSTPQPPATPAAVGVDAETKEILRDIRDSLHSLVQVLALESLMNASPIDGSSSRDAQGALRKAVDIALDRISGRSDLETSKPQEEVALVIACPGCGARIRAARPGVIRCTACSATLRLREGLFQGHTA